MPGQNSRVFRFAPSPTGSMHIGNARSALFNWLLARSTKSKFLLRIEDTDVARSEQRYAESIKETLVWLGLDWDNNEIVYQSSRFELYKEFATELISRGLAYWCDCTEEQLSIDRQKATDSELTYRYPSTCRQKALQSNFKALPLRFNIDFYKQETISFYDNIRKMVEFQTSVLDDFVIFRTDGSPTYNFCVVIDDHEMGVTDVVRAEEHVNNTPKQILLYKAFGWTAPEFTHLPMVLSPSGGKLSKRDGATSVEQYRGQGFVSQALFNYLIRLGWAHGDQEVFSRQEAINLFSMDKIGKKGAAFDLKKLQWFNSTYLKKMTPEEIDAAMLGCKFDLATPENANPQNLMQQVEVAVGKKRFELYHLFAPRAQTLVELADLIVQLARQVNSTSMLNLSENDRIIIMQFSDNLESLPDQSWVAVKIQELANQISAKHGQALYNLATVLRLSITGKPSSPNIFQIIEILGKKESLARLKLS